MSDPLLYVRVHYHAYTALLCFALLAGASTARAEGISFFSLYPKLDLKRWYISDGWANGKWQSCEWKTEAISTTGMDLTLTVSDKGGKIRPFACSEIRTIDINGYGLYEARIRSAEGSGLDTAFFIYTGPPLGTPHHDEIDFEFPGKNPYIVEVNYYTNGKTQGGTFINLGYNASKEFHNYGFDWKPDKIKWYVDGKLIHETPAHANLPVTPGHVFLSLWSGSREEDELLGPFHYQGPVAAYVSWVKYTPIR